MKPRITVMGSLNLDLVVRVENFPGPGETVSGTALERFAGGKGANQAYAAAKLGAPVSMVGQVGSDAAGDAQIANLRSVGVDTQWLLRDPVEPTGTAIIAVEKNGENRIIAVPGANRTFSPERLAPCRDLIASSSIVLVQLEVPLPTVIEAVTHARRGGAIVILDPAPAPEFQVPSELLSQAQYVTPNKSELARLSGYPLNEDSPAEEIVGAARVLCSRGANKVITKLGGKGVMLIDENSVEEIPAFPADAVDTTAAGDCFNAAFAVALLEGRAEREAALFANAAAACSVTRRGAQASMPSRSEVDSLLAR